MDYTVKKLISETARRAADMAEGAKDAFAGASRIVGEKADVAKLSLELARLQSESDEVFTQIGYTFYLMNAGRWSGEIGSGERRIEQLLSEVSEKEMLANELEQRICDLRGETTCPACHRVCDAEADFCCHCGAKLRPVTTPAEPAPPAL